MPLNPDYVGRTYESARPYEVSRVKIAEFAAAIGEQSSYCFDEDAARQAGYPDVIAPPTFAIVISTANTAHVVTDPGLGLNYSRVVHGEQAFEHSRPVHAGDRVLATTTIEQIKPLKRHTSMTMRTDLVTVDGEHICTARNTLVERGE
ncbi:MAG: MaoC family dehydratase N-terminal domain-containing protein [Streptosporangiaceae bacterium]|nr:MaoC family dehydratase N-terminal domain-containing protein [Streptosporangiaceae bacterium]